ncbi:MAG: S-layer homology domain-containing protein [Acetobacteraceae bacterium]|nr:S-layer homology domain-containing protein [Acetobacteraceae bacterium]
MLRRLSSDPWARPRLAAPISRATLLVALCLALLAFPCPQPGRAPSAAGTARAATPPGQPLPPDPWYGDVEGHWCCPYLRVLWEEGATDGYLEEKQRWNPRRHCWEPAGWEAAYCPEQKVTRGQLAMALVKAFRLKPYDRPRPSFSDVPRDYREYAIKPAYAYIEAACRGLLLAPASPTRFEPRGAVERQEAVGALVESLGLAAFAASLDPVEIRDSLSRFRDWRGVRPALLPALAAATRLGIVEGYPDRTLRPQRLLKRSEVAALLYRSCLLVLDARPNPFSPDGDGVEDSTTVLATTLRNRNLSGWSIRVTDLRGRVLKTFSPDRKSSRSEAPPPLPWDGSGEDGRPLAPGLYYLRGTVRDRSGREFDAIPRPVWLNEHRLTARLDPPLATPGAWIKVAAETRGTALVVWAHLPRQGVVALSAAEPPPSSYANTWEGRFRLEPEAAPGPYPVTVEARFPDTSRTVDLRLEVLVPLSLSGELVPNPACPAQEVAVLARTSPSAEAVEALLPGGREARLERQPPDGGETLWKTTYRVPPDEAPGSYPVRLRARAGSQTREVELSLMVEAEPRAWLNFILTD